MSLCQKIHKKLMKLRLQPIRVFCIHHVSDVFDATTMWECDWMYTDDFKAKVAAIQKEYMFISLSEACDKLKHDTIRCKKYAVLTADDGWASMKNILPWLKEQNIPITLFINPLYLDGVHKQERETEQLLTEEDIEDIILKYQNVMIASHGWGHVDTTKLNVKEFLDNVEQAENVLTQLPSKIPFYAFTYGRYKNEFIDILHEHHLVPVLIDGKMNVKYDGAIHRENLN